MKKSILFSLCLFAFVISYGQIVTLSGQQSNVEGSIENVGVDLHINFSVINATDETIDLRCRREAVTEVSGSQNQFCWGILCSPWGTGAGTSSEIVTLAPGASTNTFFANYRHNGNAGASTIRYCWYDNNNTANEYCYDVTFDIAGDNAIAETSSFAHIESIFPNPVEKTGSITYSFLSVPQSGKLVIHSMLGAKVKEVQLTSKSGAVMINAADFESGIYFCSIEDNGKVYQTSRMVISK